MEEHEFFEYGKIKLLSSDFQSRTASIEITMPCVLFQTVTPHLLGCGILDNFRIRDPIAIWLPKLSQERFTPTAQAFSNISDRINVALREEVVKTAKLFIHLQDYLADPSDAIPMLPLGVYVKFIYRCRVDDILKLLEGIDGIKVVGVPEFQWALAGVLNQVLMDFDKVTTKKQLVGI